jgi:peptidoglycan/LPS O-acetylase OafA/YrhL
MVMKRRIAWIISLLLLLFSGVVGLYNGITERNDGVTALQETVTIGVFLYGVLGIVAAYGLFRRRRWSMSAAIAWGIAVTYVPGAAVIAYAGEQSLVGSAIAASMAAAVLALGVVWTARVISRDEGGNPAAA